MSSGRFIVPGEKLGVVEEFFAGRGTYVLDGVIRSSTSGYSLVTDRVMSVYSRVRRPLLPRLGNIVLGWVTALQEKLALVQIFKAGKITLPFTFTGLLHVSQVSSKFTAKVSDAVKVGDIVRARIVSVKNHAYHLSTKGRRLGVVLTFCSRCGSSLRKELVERRWILKCDACGSYEKRKIAADYGASIESSGTQQNR